MMKKLITFLALAFIFPSCFKKYQDFDIKAETELIAPFASASYHPDDLLYDLEFPYQINTGTFFSICDTVPYHFSLLSEEISQVEITFRSMNLMPFRVDFSLLPIDTLSGIITGDTLYATMVDAAIYDPLDNDPDSVYTENSLLVDSESIEEINTSNGLVMEAIFIWPYESVTLDSLDDQLVFELQVIMDVTFLQ